MTRAFLDFLKRQTEMKSRKGQSWSSTHGIEELLSGPRNPIFRPMFFEDIDQIRKSPSSISDLLMLMPVSLTNV
jgi:hypothetical protein